MRPTLILLVILATMLGLFLAGCTAPPSGKPSAAQPASSAPIPSNLTGASDSFPSGAGRQPNLAPAACLGLGCPLPPQIRPDGPAYHPDYFVDTQPNEDIALPDGSVFNLSADIVKKTIGNRAQYLYGYNAQVPGPTLRVRQGSSITVVFTNHLDQPTTVHWHGLRQNNKDDGVPGVTQGEVQPGGNFTYHLVFPDEGAYWYHPHVREDMQQARGLYGLIIVEPSNASHYSPDATEGILALSDFMADGNGEAYPFDDAQVNFAAMGRYGNKLMANGQGSFDASLKVGQVLRLYVLNAANVRPFNLSIENTPMKMVGGDNGPYAQEFFADHLQIGPSERYIIEVSFPRAGNYSLYNVNPFSTYRLGQFVVDGPDAQPPESYLATHAYLDVSASMEVFRPYFNKTPDFEYNLNISFPGVDAGVLDEDLMGHPPDGIEWEDTMLGMNKLSGNDSLTWEIVDARTGKKNAGLRPEMKTGQVFKIRIHNLKDAPHPMQHVIHLHGARFLVMNPDTNLPEDWAWKDSVMVPSGRTVDLLAEFPNTGEWMMHCHIAEHLGAGMMMSFNAT